MSNWFDRIQTMSITEVLEYLNGYHRNETNDICGELHKVEIINVAADTPLAATVWAAPGAGKCIHITEIHMIRSAKLATVQHCLATYKDSDGTQHCFTASSIHTPSVRLTNLHIELPENTALSVSQVTPHTTATVYYEVYGYIRSL